MQNLFQLTYKLSDKITKNSRMYNEVDLELSHDQFPGENLIQERQFAPDLMLQPITTQTKFNQIQKVHLTPRKITSDFQKQKQDIPNQSKQNANESQLKNVESQDAKNFRSYLNEKVTELKKSQEINKNQRDQSQSKNNSNNLRQIINRQEAKQQENNLKKDQTKKNTQKDSQIMKTIQPNITSTNSYKQEKKKIDQEKRFSNSHTNLVKDTKDQAPGSTKKQTLNDLKKSVDLSAMNKSPKLPIITPKTNQALPSKKSITSIHEIKDLAKDTPHSSANIKQRSEKRKTPESKNSFRIKRTPNLPPPTPPPINTQKLNQHSNKSIQKQSPVHQPKNKKIREDFVRMNQKQQVLQAQILKLHHENKKVLLEMIKKYSLSTKAYDKYGIKKSMQHSNESNKVEKKSPQKKDSKESRIQRTQKILNDEKQENRQMTQSPYIIQQKKNKFLDQEVEKINNLLKAKDKQLKKMQSKLQRNAYLQFLRYAPDILEESEEDQIDDVPELAHQKKLEDKQFSNSTYSTVMGEMKNKKWGLKQRITFETHRQTQQSSVSKTTKVKNKEQTAQKKSLLNVKSPEQVDKQQSKIQVNSRLKNLLFD